MKEEWRDKGSPSLHRAGSNRLDEREGDTAAALESEHQVDNFNTLKWGMMAYLLYD